MRSRFQCPIAGLNNGAGSQSKRGVPSRGAVSMGSHSIIEVLLLRRLAPPVVAEISLSHLILSHLASYFRSPKRQTERMGRGLHVTHRAELIPTGAQQRCHLPSTDDRLGGVAAVLQGIPVARLATALLSAAVPPHRPVAGVGNQSCVKFI